MDIRMYALLGYNRKVDESTKRLMNDMQPEMDWKFIREHIYTDDHKKKLKDFNTLAQQMINCRFGFFSEDGTVFSGIIKGFSWDDAAVSIEFSLGLDIEPEADIEYSANIHSGLLVEGDKVTITDKRTPLPFNPEGIPPNSLIITL